MSDTPAPAPAPAPSAPMPVRSFTEDGLAKVAELLKTIRADGQLHRKEVEDLLVDPQYAKPLAADPQQGGLLAGDFAIDRDRVFATKLDLCQYFTALFDNAFLEAHRKDAGLWTWLALAYYPQFVKTKNGIAKLSADACWVFNPQIFRFGRRHFIAGTVYLYRDTKDSGAAAVDMLFSRPPTEFGRFIDALTNVEESIRSPAFFATAIRLYYDSGSKGNYKPAAIDQNGAGSVRQLIRVLQQFAETYDFSAASDADAVCSLLPDQFDRFKKGMASPTCS